MENKRLKCSYSPAMEAADVKPTMTTMDDLNHDCIREILSYIDVMERMKYREVSKKFCIAADACWGAVKMVRISLRRIRPKLRGIRNFIIIEISAQELVEGVLKRCGGSLKTLSHQRPNEETSLIPPLALKYCPEIKSLHTHVNTEEDDENLSQLFRRTRKLKYLYLGIHFRRATQCFRDIPTDNLEKLCFFSSSNDWDEVISGWKQVLGECSLLKQYYGYYCDDELMELIGQNIGLEGLQITKIQPGRITERGLNHILKLKNLRSLVLSAVQGTQLPLTDDFFMALGYNLPLLETLSIPRLENVTDRGFKSLASLKKLKRLSLCDCEGITDEFLVLFSGLQVLNLRGCKQIYDAGVIELIENAEKMRFLDLSGTKITGKTLEAAAEAIHNRTNGIGLYLSCDGIRVMGMRFMPGPLLKSP